MAKKRCLLKAAERLASTSTMAPSSDPTPRVFSTFRCQKEKLNGATPCCLFVTSRGVIRNPTTVILDSEDTLREVAEWEVWETLAPVRTSHIRIVEMPGRGFGMVAARAFRQGETIMAERPTLCARMDLFVNENGISVFAPPIHYYNAVRGLCDAARNDFMALRNVHPEPAADGIRGIVRTNAIMLDTFPPHSHYLAVYPTLSRSNHSCTPSANYGFDSSTFEGQLLATRDIAVGEEITLSYLTITTTRAARQAELTRRYKFTCTCEACSLPSALLVKGDTRRTLLSRLISDAKYKVRLPVRAPLKVFEMGLAWAEEENLPYEYALVAALGAKMANTNYDVKTGKFWTERAFKAWKVIKGEEWSVTALEIAESLFRFLGA